MEDKQGQDNQSRRVPTKIVPIKGDGLTALCFVAFLGFIFLFSFEFFRKNYVWLYIGFAFFVMTNRFWRFRWELAILGVLSLSVALFAGEITGLLDLLRIASFPICYFIGSNFTVEKDVKKISLKKQESRIEWLIYAFAIGTFLHFLLNFLINLGSGTDRNTIDFWSREPRSATNQVALGVVAIGVAVALFFSNRALWQKAIAVFVIGIIAFYSLKLAGRTTFVLMALVGVAGLVFMWIKNPRRDKTFLISCLLFILALLAFGMFIYNVFGIRDRVLGSNFYNRFFGEEVEVEINETSRWSQKAYYIDHFFDHLFGGSHMFEATEEYAHDILLDTHDQSGIFAFVSMAIFLAISLFKTILFVLDDRFSFNLRQLVLCVSLIFAIEFCLEPILQGVSWMFCAFCFIQGAIANAQDNMRLLSKGGEDR